MKIQSLKKIQQIKNKIKLDRDRVRNHFRNVCFRKKFSTIKDHIKYIANYYDLDEVAVISCVEDDLSIIKKQTGLY